MKFKVAGVDSLIIEFGNVISPEIHRLVMKNYEILKPHFLEVTPSYTTILVKYGIDRTYDDALEGIKNMLVEDIEELEETSEVIVIPAFYDESVGYDLKRVAEYHKISITEVIKRHSVKIYDVYAIGFLPGFAYMGIVDIPTPRIPPRSEVAKGSIGIAGEQTGVYPMKSPGGWNIIARTYKEMFSEKIDGFSLLKVGQKVKFEPITRAEFINRGGEID
ncbi:5-oxoprolinase subunit B family protein [Nautilia lithotrophica]